MATKPRNIVPLLTPELHAAFKQATQSATLSYHNGPVLSNVQVQAIFWGSWWQQSAQNVLKAKLDQFFQFIVGPTSSLMNLLAEYGVSGHPIGYGQYLGSVTVPSPTLGSTVSDLQIQQALQGWITNHSVVQPNANTLYFVYLPPGVTSTMGGESSCTNYCGYHSHIGGSIFYAVEPYITCAGCNFGSGILDSLTKVSSHELCEAITDPALNAWWDSTTSEEIGDICNGGTATLGGFLVQTEWSNKLQSCEVSPHWDTGFSGFAAVTDAPGNAYIWAYRASDGRVCIHQIAAGGTGFTQKFFSNWDPGFSSFAGFSIGGVPYVWTYKASNGTVCIHQINSGGTGFTQKYLYTWDTGFSGFAAVVDGVGTAYIWAYRASDGKVCIHQISAGGTGFTQKYFYNWDPGFSNFAGFSIGGVPYVWAYKASNGTVCIHQINSGGTGFTQKYLYTWDTGFSGFATVVDGSGTAYVWAYRASDGKVCIHQISAGGTGFTQKYLYNWDPGFSSFAGFSISATPYVWAYKTSKGIICIHRINAAGAGFTQTFMD